MCNRESENVRASEKEIQMALPTKFFSSRMRNPLYPQTGELRYCIYCSLSRTCDCVPHCAMSIPFSGTRTRSAGLISAIAKQIKGLNLKLVDRIVVKFDPFHEKVGETRKTLFYLSSPKIYVTNPSCILKTNVVCDRSEPTITFNLSTGNKVIFNCANLTALNILEYCNKHISSLVPPPEKTAKELLLEKKKSSKKRLKIKPLSKRRGIFL